MSAFLVTALGKVCSVLQNERLYVLAFRQLLKLVQCAIRWRPLPANPERNMELSPLITIGALSKRTRVHVETIRYYERIGILPKPNRSSRGRRLYVEEYGRRLVFIRRARDLGFSLNDVRALLQLNGGRRMACAKVKGITEKHIGDVRHKIKELKHLERMLSGMVTQCKGDEVSDCPILDSLAGVDTYQAEPKQRRGMRRST